MSRFLNELKKACKTSYYPKVAKALLAFVDSGNEKVLAPVKPKPSDAMYGLYWLHGVWNWLPEPHELSAEERRALHAVTVLSNGDSLASWLRWRVEKNPESEEPYLKAVREAFGNKKTDQIRAATALVDAGPRLCRGQKATPVEAFLLSLDDKSLTEVLKKSDKHACLLELLLAHAPKRVPPFVESCIYRSNRYGKFIDARSCGLLLERGGAKYEKAVAKVAHGSKDLGPRFFVGVALTKFNAKKYGGETREAARGMLASDNWAGNGKEVCAWLVQQYSAGAVEDVAAYFGRYNNTYVTEPALRTTVDVLGREAHPAVVAALKNPAPSLQRVALELLIAWGDDSDLGIIQQGFENGFQEGDAQSVVRFVVAATPWDLARLKEPIWDLLKHKSKPVRETAARTLGRLGGEMVPRAVELFEARKAATRSAAVTLLSAVATSKATKALEQRLDAEDDEEVRDQMLLALETAWEAQGKKISRKEIERRIERTLAKLDGPIAPWLDESQLPPLRYAKGRKPVSKEAVRYLLYRQSRAKEMRPDVEAKPLYALIDRTTNSDFALVLLRMFASGKMEAKDRWALAVVGLLGDDRAVAPLMQQIRAWVDNKRGKMAEYAAQALALLGTDVALCAVDALSIRYRSKQKNIGKAASESFAEAAERLGITVEELGDRVVPWLGFERDTPRVIEHGEKRIEVGIGMDFKLSYRDLVKEKKIKSLPAAIPAEVKKEFKDLGATLREVVKGQLVRMENLMVRQFRWPRQLWEELYLAHPLLLPFAVRLVWGAYDGDGNLQAAYRALEDRTFTNEEDEEFELPRKEGITIGIVHPLELTPELRQAWASHLADYDIQSPFLQLERPVVFVVDDEKQVKMSTKYRGTSLNAMTFKGRAERLGWLRGSVCDGGGITSYRKSFPGAGADAILGLEGMYIGIDMYEDIHLEDFSFVRSGSVTFGSYTYDEPGNQDDERLLAFGQVPPIVYSEIMGDLTKIVGKKEEEE